MVYWIYTYLTGLTYVAPRVKYTLSEGAPGSVESKDQQLNLYIMAVANGQYLGGNMHIAPKAEISDNKVNKDTLEEITQSTRRGRYSDG